MPLTIRLEATATELVIAGWAGRDAEGVRHHIEELAALGVPPPSRTPLFYRVAADRLTQAEHVTVLGGATSGEVEPVLVWADGALLVGVGSDHTDRESERFGVAMSKQLCPKVVGPTFWPIEEVLDRWDDLRMRSYREDQGRTSLYQDGALSALLPPQHLISMCRESGSASLAEGSVMFCGTLPALGGVRRADAFIMELYDPSRGETLGHRYSITELPVVS